LLPSVNKKVLNPIWQRLYGKIEERLLEFKMRLFSKVIFSKEDGMLPVNLLKLNVSDVIFVNNPMLIGIVPFIEL
jgi:hypothetical protein